MTGDLFIRIIRKGILFLKKRYSKLMGKKNIVVFNWYNWVQIDYERYLKKVVGYSHVERISRYKFSKVYDTYQEGEIPELISIGNFKDITFEGFNLWEICKSSVLDELLDSEVKTGTQLEVVKKYYKKSIHLMKMLHKFYHREKPYGVLVEQGFQYDMRTIVEVGRRMGVKTIAVENSFIKDMFFMDTISGSICNRHFLARNTGDILRARELTDEQREMSRHFMQNYTSQISRGTSLTDKDVNIISQKKIMLLLGQVATDASIIMDSPVYTDMAQFIFRCVSEMKKYRNNWHTIVRLHPKEAYGQNHHGVKFLNRTLNKLLNLGIDKYEHVTIYHSNEVNTYELMDISDCGLTINSQAGLELLSRYKPVITAGDAFYSGKGFTFDVNRDELLSEVIDIAINNLILSDKQKRDIDKFIYFMAFEYMYPKQISRNQKLRKLLL